MSMILAPATATAPMSLSPDNARPGFWPHIFEAAQCPYAQPKSAADARQL